MVEPPFYRQFCCEGHTKEYQRMLQDRVRISSSHRPFPSRSVPLGRNSPTKPIQIPSAHRKSAELKQQEEISQSFETTWKRRLVRVIGYDGLLRAAAHDASRLRRTSKRIERYPRVLRTYISMLMGYDGPY